MYTLLRELGAREALSREFVPFFVAFLTAETLFKFGSFALECVAFIVTWFVCSVIWSLFSRRSRHFGQGGSK